MYYKGGYCMARLVADINDNLYKKFKIIAMREDKTIKEKITEIIEDSCFDKLYEIKYIDMAEIMDIFKDWDVAQINIINGISLGYSHERTPLSDEEKLVTVEKGDLDKCKRLGLDFGEWLCNNLDNTDYASVNFVRFLPK